MSGATFGIFWSGRPIARWVKSLAEARRRFTQSVRDGAEFEGDPIPEVRFSASTGDEPDPRYVACVVNGHWDASIMAERPVWPTTEPGYGESPELVMVASGECACRPQRLVCRNVPGADGVDVPEIRCGSCGCTWRPDPVEIDWTEGERDAG